MERVLEIPGKMILGVLDNPGIWVFASPGKSWKKAFLCLYEP